MHPGGCRHHLLVHLVVATPSGLSFERGWGWGKCHGEEEEGEEEEEERERGHLHLLVWTCQAENWEKWNICEFALFEVWKIAVLASLTQEQFHSIGFIGWTMMTTCRVAKPKLLLFICFTNAKDTEGTSDVRSFNKFTRILWYVEFDHFPVKEKITFSEPGCLQIINPPPPARV